MSEQVPKTSLFSRLINAGNNPASAPLLLQHCQIVLEILENSIGRLTESLESYKKRMKRPERIQLDLQPEWKRTFKPETISSNPPTTVLPSTHSAPSSPTTPPTHTEQAMLLERENSQLFSEMTSQLASIESQILTISRLQSTLTTHLRTQHEATQQLFSQSESVHADLQRGNELLKRVRDDGSLGRRILVFLILGASLVLLLLHYLK